MTAYEYLNALREALEVLPDDERMNAIRYYEEYFLDAGPENESKVIEELGTPGQVAQNILNEYTDIVRATPRQEPEQPPPEDAPSQGEPMRAEPLGEDEQPPRSFQDGGFTPPRRSALTTLLAICGAVLLALIGIPILGGLAAAAGGLLLGAVAMVAGLAVSALVLLLGAALVLVILLVLLPVCLIVSGVVICGCSLFLWGMPASALLTLGFGLCLLALGLLLAVGCLKLGAVSFHPLMSAAGWCIDRLGQACRWCVAQCRRLLHWCGDLLRRMMDRLRGV